MTPIMQLPNTNNPAAVRAYALAMAALSQSTSADTIVSRAEIFTKYILEGSK